MTKIGLMVQRPIGRSKNIGDYVQTLSIQKVLMHYGYDYTIIDQTELCRYESEEGEKLKVVLNGWFMWNAKKWPPSEWIKPLVISIHLSPLCYDDFSRPNSIRFLKENSPIGCRDLGTKHFLENLGITAYFSGCATLLLGSLISSPCERKGYIFVDPYYNTSKDKGGGVSNALKTILLHPTIVFKLGLKKFFMNYYLGQVYVRNYFIRMLKGIYRAAIFVYHYSEIFSPDILRNAEYLSHMVKVDNDQAYTDQNYLNMAECLVEKYASAKMVITSRIHAALPCLGLDTPCIFINSSDIQSPEHRFNTPGRLDGLLQFFRSYTYTTNGFITEDEVLTRFSTITTDTQLKNKAGYLEYAKKLKDKIVDFLSQE